MPVAMTSAQKEAVLPAWSLFNRKGLVAYSLIGPRG